MSSTQNTKIYELHEAWAVARGYRTKVQAPSCKPENLHAANTNQFVKAASAKPQAPSNKLQACDSQVLYQVMLKAQSQAPSCDKSSRVNMSQGPEGALDVNSRSSYHLLCD